MSATEYDAVVTRVDGNYAWLDVQDDSGCASCSQSDTCGKRAKREPQRVRNDIGARVGQRVILSVPQGAVLKATLWTYMLPLALVLVGAASGLTLAGDPGAVAGAVAGFVAALGVLRWVEPQFRAGREPLVAMRIKEVVVQLHRNAQV